MQKAIQPTLRALPYYTVAGDLDDRYLARSLRAVFVPKLRRRLPYHHLSGLGHEAIVNFVKSNKGRFGYFVRTDISRFYPSVRHQDLIVGLQLAYRDLLGLDYVPKDFKVKYLGAVRQWSKTLPLSRGIPLGSPLSAVLAPLMLVPLWLKLKRRFEVPFVVYMDDILILCRDSQQCAEIYASLDNTLHCQFDLCLNIGKTVSGRFSDQGFDFCGWRFSGGYAGVSPDKASEFKSRFTHELTRSKGVDRVAFFKRVNRKIDGFGNYYKHGQVSKQFALLDKFIRKSVRAWFSRQGQYVAHTNGGLHSLGLHSLSLCYDKAHRGAVARQPRAVVERTPAVKPSAVDSAAFALLVEHTARLSAQLTQLIALQRRQLRVLERIFV